MTTFKLVAIIGAISASLGFGLNLYEKNKSEAASTQINQASQPLDHLPELNFPDLQGNIRSNNEWKDKVVVLNFWATWCPPCRKEMPDFIEVQTLHKDSVQFIGIAIDDKEPVQDFVDTFGINFPTLLGNMTAADLSKKLGNQFSGLPFTAIFDQNGALKFYRIGELHRDTLEKELNKLL